MEPTAADFVEALLATGLEPGAAREGFCQAALKTLRSLEAPGELAAPRNTA